MQFRDLVIGDRFEFEPIDHASLSRGPGPWVKTAARRYRREDAQWTGGASIAIRSIATTVTKPESEPTD